MHTVAHPRDLVSDVISMLLQARSDHLNESVMNRIPPYISAAAAPGSVADKAEVCE